MDRMKHAAGTKTTTGGPRARYREQTRAEIKVWAVQQPHRYLLIAGSPLPGYTAPPETLVQARAALGPFLQVFESAQPGPAVLPVVEQMATWARQDPAVADWVAQYTEAPNGMDCAGHALAGAVMAWTRMHGVVSLEVEGQFSGMGHEPRTLLEVEMNTLADTFRLA